MTLDEFKKHVADYVERIMCVPVIYFNGNGVQPVGTFATITISGLKVYDHDTEEWINEEDLTSGDVIMRGMAQPEFTVQVFGAGAMMLLKKLKSSWWSSIFMDDLNTKAIGFAGCDTITNTSGPELGSSFESRAQMSFRLNASFEERFVIDFYNKIDLIVDIAEKGYSSTKLIPEPTQEV